MSRSPNQWPRWRLIRSLLVALFVCRGLVYLGVLPVFEGWDEYQHVGYVVHVVETGRPAIPGQTHVPSSLLRELVKFPLPRGVVEHQLGRFGVVNYQTYWKLEKRPPEPRPGVLALYEAQHSWWYYRLVAPWFAALGGVTNLPLAVGGLRLLNLAFVTAAVWIVLGVVGRVVQSRRDALLIGLVLVTHPLFLINGVRVANDALGVLVATAAVALCFSLNRSHWYWRCGVIGLLTGLAILIKAVNFGLVPFVAFAWLGSASKDRLPPHHAILGGTVLVLALLAVIQGELRSNLRQFGGPTAMQEAIHNRDAGRTRVDLLKTAWSFRWDVRVQRLWLRNSFLVGGWSRQRPGQAWSNAYAWSVAAGLIGAVCATAGVGKRPALGLETQRTLVLCGVLCLGFTGALAYHMVQSKLAWGEPTTCPWYAASAFPWFLIVVTTGGLSWPAPRLRLLVPLTLTATCLGAEWFVIWRRMLPTYSGGASGVEALSRLASLQAPFFGTATIVAAELGVVLLASLLVGVGLCDRVSKNL